ncbi:restriction endonuclease subunit S [Haemophilus haemolyticus]|uniref:Type I restriction-modification system, specificity subunit S n=1 Tax=Haemophilus haemolyticus TaxID=726 RepID=A0AAQ2BKZ4_HAEHA|nr:restriction endonuclease subunit S [Haemophilus haemolyticus]TDN41409.1 Type I restriction-modification system, specificity subunit S [Haemophilus haemolyticus]
MKNNRTFLEKLLDGAEVEWKPLGDVCNFQNGFAFKSSLFKDNGFPIVRITNIDGGRVNLSDVKYFLMDDYNTDMVAYEVHKDDILIAMSGATTGKIGFYNYEHTSYLNQRVGKFLPNTNILNNRYLYHYLLSKVEDIYIISGGGAQPNLSSNRLMSEVLIPIPQLPVQTEIVKILDALTALTSELTSELTLRRKQYEYYREKLLSFDSLEQLNIGGAKKKLIDVAKIKNGKDWKHLGEGDIPIYGSGGIMGYVDTYSYDKPTVLIPRKGSITNIFYLEEPFWNVDTIYYTEINTTQILPKYFFHFMKTVDLAKLDTGSGRPSLTQAILNEIPIFVPSIEEQQRIVSILDKFETLTNSITEGLPLAIEQSQKRYEYYRELLLNFS